MIIRNKQYIVIICKCKRLQTANYIFFPNRIIISAIKYTSDNAGMLNRPKKIIEKIVTPKDSRKKTKIQIPFFVESIPSRNKLIRDNVDKKEQDKLFINDD